MCAYSARKRCNPHIIRQILHIVSFNNWDRCGTVIRPFTVFSSFRIPDFIGIRKDLENPASATITSEVVEHQHFGRFCVIWPDDYRTVSFPGGLADVFVIS